MGWGRAEQPGPSARPAGWMDLEMALGRRQWGIGEVRWTSPLRPGWAGQLSPPASGLSLLSVNTPSPSSWGPGCDPHPAVCTSAQGQPAWGGRRQLSPCCWGELRGRRCGGVGVWGALSREGATGWRESVLCPVGRAGRASPPGPLPGPSKPEQQHVVSGPLVCPGRKGWEAMEVPSPSSSISDLSIPGPVRLWAPPMQGPARPCPFCPEGRHALPCLSPSGAGPGEGRLGGPFGPLEVRC